MRHIVITLAIVFLIPMALLSQDIKGIDEIAPYSEGLAAVRKGNQWGFIDQDGVLKIDFRSDLHWNRNADTSKSDITGVRYPMFKDGRCIVQKLEDGIPIYGFIDTKGTVVIEPQFLNVRQFENGYATGVVFEKVYKGENEFKLKIYDYKYHDVIMDTSGKIDEFLAKRTNIQMKKIRYKLPTIGTKMLADNLIAVRSDDGLWEVRKWNPTNIKE